MDNKLQELTSKIYNEGVSKAQQEAEKILSEAKKKADDLVSNAKKEADSMMQGAVKNSEDLKKKTDNELKQAYQQTLRSVQQHITSMIDSKILGQQVKDAFNDKEFIKKLIETAVKNWSSEKASAGLQVILPQDTLNELDAYLKSSIAKSIQGGLEVVVDPTVKAGFKIGPADGSYQISFKAEDFENLFKNFLRPKTIQMLFKAE